MCAVICLSIFLLFFLSCKQVAMLCELQTMKIKLNAHNQRKELKRTKTKKVMLIHIKPICILIRYVS